MTNKDFSKRCNNFNLCSECPLFNKKVLCVVASVNPILTFRESLDNLVKELEDVEEVEE